MKSALADYLKKSLRTWANYAPTAAEQKEAEHFRAVIARGELEWDNLAPAPAEAVSFATNAPVNTESKEAPHRPTVRCPDGSVVYCDTGEEAPEGTPCDSEPGEGGAER